ncbi:hypothetical protein DID88_008049 [Monilinia fructigena]|uniref:Uncharacterized protein n=1 Tax=Monilinia fructigena TaxID=38457 RepID=A0A395J443_9HELO|nr:hypothetical protein DID88_008049 [Monilinia fructigena]
MPKYFPSISDDLADWAMAQPLFFTASAPTHGRHVNISPKGLPRTTFSILGPNSCAYIDATGSGIETISHIYGQKVAKSLMSNYQVLNNSYSLDAIPGLKSARKQRFNNNMFIVKVDEVLFWGKDIVKGEWRGLVLGLLVGLLIGVVTGVSVKEGTLNWGGVVERVVEVREMMGNLTGGII